MHGVVGQFLSPPIANPSNVSPFIHVYSSIDAIPVRTAFCSSHSELVLFNDALSVFMRFMQTTVTSSRSNLFQPVLQLTNFHPKVVLVQEYFSPVDEASENLRLV